MSLVVTHVSFYFVSLVNLILDWLQIQKNIEYLFYIFRGSKLSYFCARWNCLPKYEENGDTKGGENFGMAKSELLYGLVE